MMEEEYIFMNHEVDVYLHVYADDEEQARNRLKAILKDSPFLFGCSKWDLLGTIPVEILITDGDS